MLPLRTNPTRLQLPAGRPPSQFTRLQQQFQQSQKLRQAPQQQQQQVFLYWVIIHVLRTIMDTILLTWNINNFQTIYQFQRQPNRILQFNHQQNRHQQQFQQVLYFSSVQNNTMYC